MNLYADKMKLSGGLFLYCGRCHVGRCEYKDAGVEVKGQSHFERRFIAWRAGSKCASLLIKTYDMIVFAKVLKNELHSIELLVSKSYVYMQFGKKRVHLNAYKSLGNFVQPFVAAQTSI